MQWHHHFEPDVFVSERKRVLNYVDDFNLLNIICGRNPSSGRGEVVIR